MSRQSLPKSDEEKAANSGKSGIYIPAKDPPEVQATQAANRTPTHFCTVCGAEWIKWANGAWSLKSPACGPCCDNEPMGDQMKPIGGVDREEWPMCPVCMLHHRFGECTIGLRMAGLSRPLLREDPVPEPVRDTIEAVLQQGVREIPLTDGERQRVLRGDLPPELAYVPLDGESYPDDDSAVRVLRQNDCYRSRMVVGLLVLVVVFWILVGMAVFG